MKYGIQKHHESPDKSAATLVLKAFGWSLIFLLLMQLFSLRTSALSIDPKPGNRKNYTKLKSRKFQQHYLELAGGYGIWSHTFQAGMDSQQPTIDISATYGKESTPFSLMMGYMFHTAFQQEIFLFKPRNIYGAIKLSLLEAMGKKSLFDPYALLGISYWQGVLTDDVYDGIINYQEKVEKDQGIAGLMGIGVTYRVKRYRFGPQFTYHMAGTGQYLAGGFEKQDIGASYMTITLKASYRFNLGNSTGCPTYK